MSNTDLTFDELAARGAITVDVTNEDILPFAVERFGAGISVAFRTPENPDDEGLQNFVLHLIIETLDGQAYEFVLKDNHDRILHNTLTRMAIAHIMAEKFDDPEMSEVVNTLVEMTENVLDKDTSTDGNPFTPFAKQEAT